ncbi:MAG: hypothetical protein HC925_08255, partial [Coleofasciculaceae cyanobacterium SM2_3_26]|nr:hypothetical protein [Coleofasciculaceae cyanobacterium SM2_3_26]
MHFSLLHSLNPQKILSSTPLCATLLYPPFLPLLALGCLTPEALAEGSRELRQGANGQGNRPYLEWAPSVDVLGSGVPRRSIISVYVEAGEQINLGSSVPNSINPGADILLRAPDGSVAETCDVLESGFGYIDTPQKELAGPAVAGGYDPCTFTATQTGIYEVEFRSQQVFAGSATDPRGVGVNQFPANLLADQRIGVAAWDVTIFQTPDDPSTEVTGRAFANYLTLNTGNFSDTLHSTAFVLTDDGYLYEVGLNGMQPFAFLFWSDETGFVDATGNPRFQSLDGIPATAINNPDDFANDDITNKIFFNNPIAALTGVTSALSPDGVTSLLNNPVPPQAPTNFTFTGAAGTAGLTTVSAGGAFNFETAPGTDGIVSIEIDVNQDGIFGNGSDRVLTRVVSGGANSIPWDGLDELGNPVPIGDYSGNIRAALNVGNVHFPFLDVENNADGIIIERINALPGDTVFFDDRPISNGQSALSGVPSSGGAHAWTNNFGNERSIDTWAAVPSPPVPIAQLQIVDVLPPVPPPAPL